MAIDTGLLAATRANMQSVGWGMPLAIGIANPSGYTVTPEGTEITYGATIATVGRYAELSGQELLRAQQLAAEATTKVTMPALIAVFQRSRISFTDEADVSFLLEVVYIAKRAQELTRIVYCKNFGLLT